MSTSLEYAVGDCISYRDSSVDLDVVHLGIITALSNNILNMITFRKEGVDEDHFQMQILKCDTEQAYAPVDIVIVNIILVLPARYYTSGVGADLHINQLNKLPCFEGIEDIYTILDVPVELVKFFEIPSFYGSEDIHSKRAVNPEQLLELISKRHFQYKAFSLYRVRCHFILQFYEDLRKYKRLDWRNNACKISYICLPTDYLKWLITTLCNFATVYKYSVKKAKTSRYTYGVVQHDYDMVVADAVFVSTEFSISVSAKHLIPVLGVGCFRQICPGHGGKRATETAINYVDGDMKFVINFLEGSVKIFCPVRKEAFGLPEIICPKLVHPFDNISEVNHPLRKRKNAGNVANMKQCHICKQWYHRVNRHLEQVHKLVLGVYLLSDTTDELHDALPADMDTAI